MEIIKIEPAFTDNRGSLWDLLTKQNVSHIGMLTSKKGSIRAKHYHKIEKQYTLILEGKNKVTIKDLSKKDSDIEVIELKKMEMILVPPLHYHEFEALEDSKLLFFTTVNRDDGGYEDDTIRIDDIKSFILS